MKTFNALKNLTARTRDRANRVLMLLAVGLLASPAFAQNNASGNLPTLTAPSGQTVAGIGGDTNWMTQMASWFKMGLTILLLVVVAFAFINVLTGGLTKWRAYTQGRAELADLKEYFILGSVLAVFVVLMAGYAFKTIA